MCKSALLFSKKDYALGNTLRNICRDQKINLAYALTFPEVLNYSIISCPEILFFDAEGVDFNYDLYKDFLESRYFEIPKIIIFTFNPDKYKFKDENILILDKMNYVEKVEKFIKNIEEKKSKKITQAELEKYKQNIAELLAKIGITTKYLGYEYIKELVIDIINDKRMLKSFNTKLYPQLAMKYNTQINNVERNIRNAIGIAKKNCKDKELYNRICGKLNTPSNKQFITWLVEEVS